MRSGCVLDAELFRKYCSNDNCDSIFSVAKCLIKTGQDNSVVRECSCLFDFLEVITFGNCILHYSDEIKDEYLVLINILPEDILDYLEQILSCSDFSRKIIKGGFKFKDFENLKSTKLEHKKIYLDATKSLEDERIIVSSEEDIRNNYKPHRDILMNHDIYSKSVCKQWTDLKECLMKQI